jgi:hypothetical protein
LCGRTIREQGEADGGPRGDLLSMFRGIEVFRSRVTGVLRSIQGGLLGDSVTGLHSPVVDFRPESRPATHYIDPGPERVGSVTNCRLKPASTSN